MAVPAAILVFFTAFFYTRHQGMAHQAQALQEYNRGLKRDLLARQADQPEKVVVTQAPASNSGEAIAEVESRLRAEYNQSIAAITAELTALYDMEAKARDITGLAPRAASASSEAESTGGGKGGPPTGIGAMAMHVVDESMRPPHLIYGMTRPSADLILEEIHLRHESLDELVGQMEAKIDRIERIPTGMPLKNGQGRLTSRYGYRRDPFHGRLRHHDGIDIGDSRGTPVRATAKGTVKTSEYDRYMGHYIVLDHGNGMETLYAHLSKRQVEAGQSIQRNAIIGNLGSTGRSTGAHLHYEVHVDGKPVDAEKYLTD